MMGLFYAFVVILAIVTGLFKSWKRSPANMKLPDLTPQKG
jgi:hypothetical protein